MSVGVITDMSHLISIYNENKNEYDEDIDNWNISNVKSMDYMFFGAKLFNQSLNQWDVSNVKNMSHMFYWAVSFNQSLNSWDVSSVKNMDYMFNNATLEMFYKAISFDMNNALWYNEK